MAGKRKHVSMRSTIRSRAKVLEVDGYVGEKLYGTYRFEPPYLPLWSCREPKYGFLCTFLAAHFFSPFERSGFTLSGLVFIFGLFSTGLQSLLNFIVGCLFCTLSSLIPVTSMINFVCNLRLIDNAQNEGEEHGEK